ncbi:vanadium-dependent haloperoxidase [Frigidibacter sp. SD6-1]|uniref:vanadium-dependent haloperoxidase n=1 Tax=Frigidibacter sp. SD6-1 TaxID=3032581 RepID=UPI0024DF9FE0|nr:vanadium-dependent haloperoxidase [Frigidibacter sp. SD6-1]
MHSLTRRQAIGGLSTAFLLPALPAHAAPAPSPQKIISVWYGLILDLVRHTPTYTPPVVSRALGYAGVAVHEATASGRDDLLTLAGQLNGLAAGPVREAGAYDEAMVLHAALAGVVARLFFNTGPTGQRALKAVTEKLGAAIEAPLAPEVARRSRAYGEAFAAHVLDWAAGDGGAEIVSLGFPEDHALTPGPAHWVPTNRIALQQKPLLPHWGANRTFAMPQGTSCRLPPPPAYSEDEGSEFYKQAVEVYEVSKTLTEDQRAVALFWSDDAMLSRTPPGHWMSIALDALAAEGADQARYADVVARLGVALADAFIGCWQGKYEYDLLRPVTYINRLIDPTWTPFLATPPFPEYPSGHSTQSGAAAEVLSALFGADHAFTDETPTIEGMAPRSFASFWAAADEAGISRLYGGIHYRAAIERGLDQGRCIAAHTNALKTRRT